jgi:hypothetical protein
MRQRADGAVVAMDVDSGVIVMYAIVGVNNCVFVGEDNFAAMSVWARTTLSPPLSLCLSLSLSLGKLSSRTFSCVLTALRIDGRARRHTSACVGTPLPAVFNSFYILYMMR